MINIDLGKQKIKGYGNKDKQARYRTHQKGLADFGFTDEIAKFNSVRGACRHIRNLVQETSRLNHGKNRDREGNFKPLWKTDVRGQE